MKRTTILKVTTLCHVAMTLAIFLIITGCTKNASTAAPAANENEDTATVEDLSAAEEPTDTATTYMKAPDIVPNANGFISLNQCPTSDPHLRVELNEEKTTATIYYDNELIQTLTNEEDPLATDGDEKLIHFIDANFDGFADILIGPCESRTYSTLLIWDDSTKQFFRLGTLGEPSLQNLKLHPSTKTLFEGGSNSWCCESYTRNIWKGGKIAVQEELIIVNEPEQYGEYEVSNQFTLRNANQEETASEASPTKLPELWQGLINELDVE